MQTYTLFKMYFLEINLEVRTKDLHKHLHRLFRNESDRAALMDKVRGGQGMGFFLFLCLSINIATNLLPLPLHPQIMDFYHEERLHLLYSQKHLLAFHRSQDARFMTAIPAYQTAVSAMTIGGLSDEVRVGGSRRFPNPRS